MYIDANDTDVASLVIHVASFSSAVKFQVCDAHLYTMKEEVYYTDMVPTIGSKDLGQLHASPHPSLRLLTVSHPIHHDYR
jgi:hypothetical protein